LNGECKSLSLSHFSNLIKQHFGVRELEEFFTKEKFAKIEKLLEMSVFSTTMQINLINDLLDLAKLEKNTFTFNFEFFSIIETIKNAFKQLSY